MSVIPYTQLSPGGWDHELLYHRALGSIKVDRQVVLIGDPDTGCNQSRDQVLTRIEVIAQESLFHTDLSQYGATLYTGIGYFKFGEE
ncbi:hypothetical protein D3C72_1075430 [compost metagenome]